VTASAISSGDLLSAESLILTIVSGVLALWYSEIQTALHLEKRLRVEDRKPEIDVMTRTLWRRAVPLTLIAGAAAAVFAPNSIRLLHRAKPLVADGDTPPYDPIAVSIVAVNIGMAVVAIYAAALAVSLLRRRRSFREPK
jgi:hypothetical protein